MADWKSAERIRVKNSAKTNIYIYTLCIQSYSQMMIGVSNHLLSIVFRFHCHSKEVIGSLGIYQKRSKNARENYLFCKEDLI